MSDHPFVDEEARKTSTIVTKNSVAIPEDRQKYKLSERAWNWEKIVDLFPPRTVSKKEQICEDFSARIKG